MTDYDCAYCINDQCMCNEFVHGPKLCKVSPLHKATTQVNGTAVCSSCAKGLLDQTLFITKEN